MILTSCKGIQDSLGLWIPCHGLHSHANKTHFHKKGCAPSLILKVRVGGTRKWPIVGGIQDTLSCISDSKAQDFGFRK